LATSQNPLKKKSWQQVRVLVTAYFNHSHTKEFKVLNTGQLQHMFAK
jgi:hypothetical protein